MARYNEKRTTTREELSGIAVSLRMAAAGIQATAEEMTDLNIKELDVKLWKTAIEAVDKASKFSGAVAQAASALGVDPEEIAAINQRKPKEADQESHKTPKHPEKRETSKPELPAQS